MQNMYEYNEVVRKMRFFFQEAKGFVERFYWLPRKQRRANFGYCGKK